jgi:hypothetical protein
VFEKSAKIYRAFSKAPKNLNCSAHTNIQFFTFFMFKKVKCILNIFEYGQDCFGHPLGKSAEKYKVKK